MSAINIALSGLLVALLFFTFPNLRRLVSVGITLWVWLICLLLSGTATWLVIYLLDAVGGHSDGLILLLINPLGWLAIALVFIIPSDLAFLVLYRVFGYGIFALIERRWKVELAKPSTKLGLVFAPICPVIAWSVYSTFKER
jgi:hypothetical protein